VSISKYAIVHQKSGGGSLGKGVFGMVLCTGRLGMVVPLAVEGRGEEGKGIEYDRCQQVSHGSLCT
jgi:hypothetical protein